MKKRLDDPKLPMRIHLQPITGPSVETKSWVCGECFAYCRDHEAAYNCCRTKVCACGEKISAEDENYYSCRRCRIKSAAERAQQDWDKMPLIEYTGEPVYDDNTEKYFENLEEMEDYYACEEDKLPEFVEMCESKKIGFNLDINRILDRIVEEMTEDCEEPDDAKIVGVDELHKAMEDFLAKQTQEFWVPVGKKIKVPAEENTSTM